MSVLDEQESQALRELQSENERSKQVLPFELLNSEARVRSKLSLVHSASDAFAERFSSIQTRARKRASKVVAEPPTMLASADRDERLKREGIVCVVDTQATSGAQGVGLLHLGAALVYEVVDRRFGGSGVVPTLTSPRVSWSGIERATALQIAETLLTELNAVREDLWPSLRVRSVVTKPDSVAALVGRQTLLCLEWTQTAEPVVSLFLPGDAIDARDHGKGSAPVSESWRQQFNESVSDASLELVVELGSATLELREVLALEPGRILRLDRGAADKLDVCVLGECVFDGTPSSEGDHLRFTLDTWRSR